MQTVETTTSSPNSTNAVLAAVFSERDANLIREGWCAAFNTWWKYKDDGLDFRQMETKLCEAIERVLNGS
jgi:hypothetical protein